MINTITSHVAVDGTAFTLRTLPNGDVMLTATTGLELVFPSRAAALRYARDGLRGVSAPYA